MNLTTKIRAGALQFVLFIGVVIALLLLAFITLSHTHTFFGKKTDLFISTIKQADLGLQYAINNTLPLNDTVVLDFNPESEIMVKAVKSYWGVYENYTVISSFNKNKFTRYSLVGQATSAEDPALYLKDVNRPLIIVGNSKIKGNVFLPKQGIRTGNISGNSYNRQQLFYGKQLASKSSLPSIKSEIRDNLFELLSGSSFYNLKETVSIKEGEELQNSFGGNVKLIVGENIQLMNVRLTGNIVVRASRKIVVDASSQLQDVILVAPEIVIKNGVNGVMQAIASKQIIVGENCNLTYPSTIVVDDKSLGNQNLEKDIRSNIIIGKHTTIQGIVMYLGAKNEQFKVPHIAVKDNAIVTGEVYCEKNLELKGRVYGSVITAGFVAVENGSIYQNHLYNGQIDRVQLTKQYVGLQYDAQEIRKSVSKWLY
ncbi:MAG: hypothetical protein ACSHW4_15860 [Cellulophaga sp.]